MREIKFRAWNEEENEMVHFDFGTIDDGYCYGGQHPIYDLDEVPVMQYTGLKDKNGKDVYEGDILRWFNGSELIGRPKVVESTDGGWNPFIDDMQTDGAWHYEVIGNIYENKELLDG